MWPRESSWRHLPHKGGPSGGPNSRAALLVQLYCQQILVSRSLAEGKALVQRARF